MKNLLIIVVLAVGLYMPLAANITLEMLDKERMMNLCAIEQELQKVYMASFGKIYKDYWTSELEQRCIDGFNNYIGQLKQNDALFLVVAKKDEQVAGWILFLCKEQSAIIELICVNPEYQRQGIGKALIFSIKDYARHIQSLAVVTRKINAVSPIFYENLGFVRTSFMLPEYSADEVQGYECLINDLR